MVRLVRMGLTAIPINKLDRTKNRLTIWCGLVRLWCGEPMRICSGAGCLRAVPDGVRLCAECSGPTKSHTYADRERCAHLYRTSRWKTKSASVLRRDPICKLCDVAISEVADHRVPASEAVRQVQESGRWPLDPVAGFFLAANLQGLCRACHKRKTDADKAHQGPWPDVLAAHDAMPKRKWVF